MKRDMDLVRQILLKEEEAPPPGASMLALFPECKDDKAEQLRIASHIDMMVNQAGLLDGVSLRTLGSFHWANLRLTWAGSDYHDATRDPRVWKEAKVTAQKAGGFTVEVLKACAIAVIKAKAKAMGLDIA